MTDSAPVLRSIALAAFLVGAEASAVAKDVANPDLKYTVTIPDDCAAEATTDTLEVVCAPDRSAASVADTPKARAFFLEVDAEQVPANAKPYAAADFRADVPDAVCGAGEPSDVRIENMAEIPSGQLRIFTADVVCPPIQFLGLEERRASVRYVIGTKMRYRLMYRAPAAAIDKNLATGRSFLDSFKTTAE